MLLSGEDLRVHDHIAGAERFARRAKPRLDPSRRLVRALLLDELARYRRALRFPRNTDFRAKQVPYFVDATGTRCAVAHLLELGGQGHLVRKIAGAKNHATVHELANERALLAWLDAAGLTVAEAARIQPSYCLTNALHCCQSVNPFTQAVIEGTVIQQSSATMGGSVHIDRIIDDGNVMTPSLAPGQLVVGQELPARVNSPVGSQVVLTAATFTPIGDATTKTEIVEVFELTLNDTTVTCETDFGKKHPIPKDVAYRALRAGHPEQCEAELATSNPAWYDRICDDSGCSCQLGSHNDGGPISTLAILTALLCFRARRRLVSRNAGNFPT